MVLLNLKQLKPWLQLPPAFRTCLILEHWAQTSLILSQWKTNREPQLLFLFKAVIDSADNLSQLNLQSQNWNFISISFLFHFLFFLLSFIFFFFFSFLLFSFFPFFAVFFPFFFLYFSFFLSLLVFPLYSPYGSIGKKQAGLLSEVVKIHAKHQEKSGKL